MKSFQISSLTIDAYSFKAKTIINSIVQLWETGFKINLTAYFEKKK